MGCEVNGALGSITTNEASGGDGIAAELFQILKDDAVKGLRSICKKMENSAVTTGLEKVSFHSYPRHRPKNAQITSQLHSSHMLAK